MVRLKLKYEWFKNKNDFGLNSTMVRLKLYTGFNKTCKMAESQFHYGSIKTMHWGFKEIKGSMSQFQYGSIKTKINLSEKLSQG